MAAVMLVQLAAPSTAASPSAAEVTERVLIIDLMNRYGYVHDFGTPDEYAALFAVEGEIASPAGKVLVKGRDKIRETAVRDHERWGGVKLPDGQTSSLMRHIISNPVITSFSGNRATGVSYVQTLVTKDPVPLSLMSVARYLDDFVKEDGEWRIARRRIVLDFGNAEIGKALGFR